jgi:hypothetical protein
MIRRHLFTMLRGALLPRRLGSGTILTPHPRRYPTPVSGWNRNEQGGAAGRTDGRIVDRSEKSLNVDPVDPKVDIALGSKITLRPAHMLVDPSVLEPRDG